MTAEARIHGQIGGHRTRRERAAEAASSLIHIRPPPRAQSTNLDPAGGKGSPCARDSGDAVDSRYVSDPDGSLATPPKHTIRMLRAPP
jgi:hypothetical protein